MENKNKKLIEKARNNEDPGERREAVIDLGYQKLKDICPVLIELLDDPSASIRHAAVISLGRFGDPIAIDELIKPKILSSSVTNIRWAAVIAVGQLGDYRVINHLLKAVDDPEWIVRNQAVTELKDKIQEIIEIKDIKHARILMRLLSLKNEEIVELAIEGFYQLGDQSIDILLEALRYHSPALRKNAARALGKLNSSRAVDYLIDIINDPEWDVRIGVVEALGEIGDKRAVEPLVRSLTDNVEKVQKQAIESLVNFGRLSTEPLLNALSYEKDKFSLRAIIFTLGRICDPKAVPVLVNYLRSSYFVVRMAAVQALIQFGSSLVDILIPYLSFNTSDIGLLLKDAEGNDNQPLQLRAIKALSGLEDHRTVNILKKLVEKGSLKVQDAAALALIQIGCSAWRRCGAIMILGRVGNEQVVPHIIESLKDDSDNVRLEAVKALAKIGGNNAVDPLVKTAKSDRDPYIRYEAVRVLRRIGVGHHNVLDLALSALKDKNRDVRSQAARLLGNFQDERSIQPLLDATADKHWSVRESAENALINFSHKAVSHLLKALSKRTWTTRFRAVRLLGEIGDKRAIKPLEQLLEKKNEKKKVKEIIQESLKKLYVNIAA